MATIVPLAAVEPRDLEVLLDAAFEPTRKARTSYLIRQGTQPLPALSYAALDDEDWLVGAIQISPAALTDAQARAHPLLMVGPVAVHPAHQGEGYGTALMAAALAALESGVREGASALPQVLIGDAPYYGRFGFRQAPAGWRCPGPWDPARLLVRCETVALLPPEGMLGPWPGPGLAN